MHQTRNFGQEPLSNWTRDRFLTHSSPGAIRDREERVREYVNRYAATAVGLLAGLAITVWGIAADGRVGPNDLLTIGVIVLAAAGVATLRRPSGPVTDRALDRAIRAGWTRGHAEGRRAGLPVVVKANCPACGENLYRAS